MGMEMKRRGFLKTMAAGVGGLSVVGARGEAPRAARVSPPNPGEGRGANPPGVRFATKAGYLDLMEKAVGAYSDEQIARYLASAEKDGVQEHGFPRLTANIGVLLAQGRLAPKKDLFRRMMGVSCRDAAKGKMPPKSGGNEFSVKELVTALLEIEKAGIYPKPVTDAWRASLAAVSPRKCYTVLPRVGDPVSKNWCVFGCASEQARMAAGLGGDAGHVEKYVADQLRWFDANGMYRDPHQPIVYDVVTRLQFALILYYGYNGPSKVKLEELFDTSAEPTLKMLSASGEIPYGGRSNQFLHNHTFYAALCEWYAARFAKRGNLAKAVEFRRAAMIAVDALTDWLAAKPVRHVKNLYPRESGIGCEGYAYFDKYMVTMGSWAMVGWMFANEAVDQSCEACGGKTPSFPPSEPDLFVTSPDFHLVLARAGDYSAEFDYDADPHYDADGLGRLQRRGAPPAICMASPCAQKPNYKLEKPNDVPLAILPVAAKDAKLVLISASLGPGKPTSAVCVSWKLGDLDWNCRLANDGMRMTLDGAGALALSIPAFEFDGEAATKMVNGGTSLTVSYRGWKCIYTTSGEIVDSGQSCCNRNGRYRRFEARGVKRLSLHIEIERMEDALSAAARP